MGHARAGLDKRRESPSVSTAPGRGAADAAPASACQQADQIRSTGLLIYLAARCRKLQAHHLATRCYSWWSTSTMARSTSLAALAVSALALGASAKSPTGPVNLCVCAHLAPLSFSTVVAGGFPA